MHKGPRHPSQWNLIRRAIVADRPALAGLCFIAAVVVVSAAIPLFSPYDPTAPVDGPRLAPPLTPGHLLGIDSQQRDVLVRLLWGGANLLALGRPSYRGRDAGQSRARFDGSVRRRVRGNGD